MQTQVFLKILHADRRSRPEKPIGEANQSPATRGKRSTSIAESSDALELRIRTTPIKLLSAVERTHGILNRGRLRSCCRHRRCPRSRYDPPWLGRLWHPGGGKTAGLTNHRLAVGSWLVVMSWLVETSWRDRLQTLTGCRMKSRSWLQRSSRHQAGSLVSIGLVTIGTITRWRWRLSQIDGFHGAGKRRGSIDVVHRRRNPVRRGTCLCGPICGLDRSATKGDRRRNSTRRHDCPGWIRPHHRRRRHNPDGIPSIGSGLIVGSASQWLDLSAHRTCWLGRQVGRQIVWIGRRIGSRARRWHAGRLTEGWRRRHDWKASGGLCRLHRPRSHWIGCGRIRIPATTQERDPAGSEYRGDQEVPSRPRLGVTGHATVVFWSQFHGQSSKQNREAHWL